MRIPLLGGAYEGISTNISSQEAINFYFEPPAPGESHQGAYLPVHGADLFDTLANTGVIRALLYEPVDELLYIVSDDTLYSETSGAVETSRDTLATTTGRVEMALNPVSREILTVDGNTGLHYDIATTTGVDISDSNFPDTASTCAYINERFLVNDPTVAGKFWWSDLNDGTTWTSTNFATAETLTSEVKKILVDKNDIYLFGDQNSEVWYNTGDADNTFQRFELIDTGICAPASAVSFDNSVVWLARSKRGEVEAVRAGSGFEPIVFSTVELSRKWSVLSSVDDAFGMAITLDGHAFYILTFPTGDATYVYDATTKRWSQWSGAFSSSEPTRYPPNAIVFCGAWGGHIAGDSTSTGKLWSLQESVYTWDSDQMERRITGPLLSSSDEDRLKFSEVQLDCEEGVLDAADTGTERTVTLSWSIDGGHNYNTGVDLDLGESDEREKRLIVRKLGQGRLWAFRAYTKTNRKIVIKGLIGRLFGQPAA